MPLRLARFLALHAYARRRKFAPDTASINVLGVVWKDDGFDRGRVRRSVRSGLRAACIAGHPSAVFSLGEFHRPISINNASPPSARADHSAKALRSAIVVDAVATAHLPRRRSALFVATAS